MSLLTKTNGGLRTRSLFPRSLFNDDFFTMNWPAFDLLENDGFEGDWIPAANVRESDKSFAIELTAPGYEKKDIHVKVDNNNVLRISAERKEEFEESEEQYTRREFSFGSFNRSFTLPETVETGKIAAKCKDGVLTVELPKKKEAVKKIVEKEIKIS